MTFALSQSELESLRALLAQRQQQAQEIERWFEGLSEEEQDEVTDEPLSYPAIKLLNDTNQKINNWLSRAFDEEDRSLYHDERGFSQLGAPMLSFNDVKYDPDRVLPQWPSWEDLLLWTFDDTNSLHDLLYLDDHLVALQRLSQSPYPKLTASQRKRLLTVALQAQVLAEALRDIAESR